MPDQRQPGSSVDLRDVAKRYGTVDALRGISVRVEPGEFVTLLGPSGSGKTTTLNVIAGFTNLSSGDIAIDDVPIASVPPHKRNLGMIFQNYALFPHMTAFQNVAYPLKQRKVNRSEIRSRVESALELVGLRGTGERYPRQLSGGQQQRVAFARAIVFNPKVLLMDEPLGALDRKLRESLQGEIKRIHRELGITFIYVTHDQDEALALSDRIAVFNDGAIEQIGSPSELYDHPQTRFVAEFIGESNVFEGELNGDGGQATLVCREGKLAVSRAAGDLHSSGVLVLRPQRMQLLQDDATHCDNVLAGRVSDIAFLGSSSKLQVELEMGGRMTVRQAAHLANGIAVGDHVGVGWNADDGIVLPERAAGTRVES